jgi:predicted Zn-dependent peptidase
MYQETVLNNGLIIITHRMPQRASASIGFWIRAGGRFETRENNGISHFLEHLLFKGTKKGRSIKLKRRLKEEEGTSMALLPRRRLAT